jgi:hypothetical protein
VLHGLSNRGILAKMLTWQNCNQGALQTLVAPPKKTGRKCVIFHEFSGTSCVSKIEFSLEADGAMTVLTLKRWCDVI